MWKSNLIIALRVLGRNKAISLINVVGLSAALAVVVLCLLFVRHETSYDSWHEKGDRIFLIYFENLDPGNLFNEGTTLPPELGRSVRTTVAGIRESVHMHRAFGKVSYGEATFWGNFLAVDPAFLTIQCSLFRLLPVILQPPSTSLTVSSSPMKRRRNTSGPMFQSVPCWGSASGCKSSTRITPRHHRRKRLSRWNAPSRECWPLCRDLLFCIWISSCPRQQSRSWN